MELIFSVPLRVKCTGAFKLKHKYTNESTIIMNQIYHLMTRCTSTLTNVTPWDIMIQFLMIHWCWYRFYASVIFFGKKMVLILMFNTQTRVKIIRELNHVFPCTPWDAKFQTFEMRCWCHSYLISTDAYIILKVSMCIVYLKH